MRSQHSTHGDEAESPHRWAMVIDQARCTGCEYCTMACRAQNDVNPDMSWNRVLEVETVGTKEVFLPVPCMQCQDAPCIGVCPVSASYRRPDGIIMMDYDRCIGCRYCEIAFLYCSGVFRDLQSDPERPAAEVRL
ncbi:MAG: hypothetical protein KC425_19835 [Anaerolineales bacterium]|nr:hypothetical protein [Anaerolineales bacterium]